MIALSNKGKSFKLKPCFQVIATDAMSNLSNYSDQMEILIY